MAGPSGSGSGSVPQKHLRVELVKYRFRGRDKGLFCYEDLLCPACGGVQGSGSLGSGSGDPPDCPSEAWLLGYQDYYCVQQIAVPPPNFPPPFGFTVEEWVYYVCLTMECALQYGCPAVPSEGGAPSWPGPPTSACNEYVLLFTLYIYSMWVAQGKPDEWPLDPDAPGPDPIDTEIVGLDLELAGYLVPSDFKEVSTRCVDVHICDGRCGA